MAGMHVTNWLSDNTFFSEPLCWYVCKEWIIEISSHKHMCDNGSKDKDKFYHTSVWKALKESIGQREMTSNLA